MFIQFVHTLMETSQRGPEGSLNRKEFVTSTPDRIFNETTIVRPIKKLALIFFFISTSIKFYDIQHENHLSLCNITSRVCTVVVVVYSCRIGTTGFTGLLAISDVPQVVHIATDMQRTRDGSSEVENYSRERSTAISITFQNLNLVGPWKLPSSFATNLTMGTIPFLRFASKIVLKSS